MIDKKCADGVIVKGIGGFYYISHDGQITECHARGKFRKADISPIVGDNVTIQINEDNTGSIVKIHERKNFLIRPGVANLDAVVIVSAARSPMPDFFLIDKLLVSAESKGIEAIICLNKTDLVDEDEANNFSSVYEKAGYKVVSASAKTGKGTEDIQSILKGKTVAFAGLSGVGKSSLIKRITGLDLQTGGVSKIERGKHTTRHVELFPFNDGFVFDTPGFSRLETDELYASDLWQYFPEMRFFEGQCRFRTCSHRSEIGCSVIEAVKNGQIAQSRYESYKTLFNTLNEIKDWQRKDVNT